MFCKYCGNELEDEAKFCTSCGHEVLRKSEDETQVDSEATADSADKANAADAEAAPAETEASAKASSGNAENTSFKAAVKSTGRKQRSKFAMVLIVVLALSLVTGAAFAAHYVYTTYIAPQPQATEQTAGEDVDGDGEVEVATATGNPQNFLQIAELLAMNPADIPAYLESQGLTEEVFSGQDYTAENPFAYDETSYAYDSYSVWSLGANEEALRVLDENGEFFLSDSELTQANTSLNSTFGIELGTSLLGLSHSFGDKNESVASTSDLKNGTTPTSVEIKLPLAVHNNTLNAFIEACGLGKPLATFVPDTKPVEYQLDIQFITGKASVNDKDYFWYLMHDTGNPREDDEGSYWIYPDTMGMYQAGDAKAIVLATGFYTEEEWNEASSEEQAKMLAQSIAQDFYTGNGETRINVLTGESEIDMSVTTGSEEPDWQPMTEENQAKVYGTSTGY